jgi:predicted MFS family arabinose efflux permease
MMPRLAAACGGRGSAGEIALGAAVGGWVFDASGYQATFGLSAGILFIAGLLVLAA